MLIYLVKLNTSLSAKLNSMYVCLGNGNLKQMKNAPQHHQEEDESNFRITKSDVRSRDDYDVQFVCQSDASPAFL
jgi:hypothetical protein